MYQIHKRSISLLLNTNFYMPHNVELFSFRNKIFKETGQKYTYIPGLFWHFLSEFQRIRMGNQKGV
jgi:hypothetical protein